MRVVTTGPITYEGKARTVQLEGRGHGVRNANSVARRAIPRQLRQNRSVDVHHPSVGPEDTSAGELEHSHFRPRSRQRKMKRLRSQI